MQDVLNHIFFMSWSAAWFILAVLCLRALFWKAPRWIFCFLWFLVGLRLVCPIHVESPVSLLPARAVIPFAGREYDMTGETGIIYPAGVRAEKTTDEVAATDPGESAEKKAETAGAWMNAGNPYILVVTVIWAAGVIAMLVFLAVSFLRVRKRVCTATRRQDEIWECEFVDSPFVFGLVRPRIYVPYHLEEKQLTYILAHERAHLKRGDHIVKVLAWIILSVYWFHPLVWLAYIFLGRDIELACDEKAVLAMGAQEKKEYLLTLLSYSTDHAVCLLAFGKVGVKERVIRVKNFKKPSVILTASALIIGVAIAACLLTNPGKPKAVVKDEAVTETGGGDSPDSKDVSEARQASLDLGESTGADGAILYFVDREKIIFGGSFGLFVFDKTAGRVSTSLDLAYIDCNRTQGDGYCEIAADRDGSKVYLHPLGKNILYTFEILSRSLQKTDYTGKSIWKDNSLNLFRVDEQRQTRYQDGDEEKICGLHESDFIIGNCTYYEYNAGETDGKQKVYHRLFPK